MTPSQEGPTPMNQTTSATPTQLADCVLEDAAAGRVTLAEHCSLRILDRHRYTGADAGPDSLWEALVAIEHLAPRRP